MKYFLIAGEASGDLHASRLMRALKERDPEADFAFYGGDEMAAAGGTLLRHYRDLAYMGFIPVLLHLPAILRGMKQCRKEIRAARPDVLILVDYPGFNLDMAKFAHRAGLCPVFYYISPKIWAWKEGRIRRIRRYVDALFSILPFEVDWFASRHGYRVEYVGNPTVDEVAAYVQAHGASRPDGRTLALLPGSRRQEVKDNLSRMLRAASACADHGYRLVVAVAAAIERDFYEDIIRRSGVEAGRVELWQGRTYELLSCAEAALVTSGTATLETALFRVPQVVCYYVPCGSLVRLLRRLLLKCRWVSLVNLIADEEIVPELVADAMEPAGLREHLLRILSGGEGREAQLEGYDRMARRLGAPGAPRQAAEAMLRRLSARETKAADTTARSRR